MKTGKKSRKFFLGAVIGWGILLFWIGGRRVGSEQEMQQNGSDMRVEITADRQTCKVGEPVSISVSVRNQGKESIQEIFLNCVPGAYRTCLAELLPGEEQVFTAGESMKLLYFPTAQDADRGYWNVQAEAEGRLYDEEPVRTQDQLRIAVIP